MPTETCHKQCGSCALLPGSETNAQEPHNHLRAILAVLTPFAFHCHDFADWKDHDTRTVRSRKDYREKGVRICGGWYAAVKELAAVLRSFNLCKVATLFYANYNG